MKSQKRQITTSLADGAFKTMAEAIQLNSTPNLFALHYDAITWSVRNLLLIPRFSYTLSAIKCRKPLGPAAERRGWVGCSINLTRIPPEAKIPVVEEGSVRPISEVRTRFRKLHKLGEKSAEARRWTLDVLNTVHTLSKREFSLADIYKFEAELASLHPANRHVQPKIRQQLQELRKMGILEFLTPGHYRLR
jgi:type II restriction enzyme